MEGGQNSLLKRSLEVNEYVSTAQEVDFGKRGIARDVVRDEDTNVTHALLNAVASFGLLEKIASPLFTHVSHRRFGIEPSACTLDHFLADVRAENLQRIGPCVFAQILDEGDRDR